jgi:hypothetical protein
MRRYIRSGRSRHPCPKSYEHRESNDAGSIESEDTGGYSQGAGEEVGGCEEGVLWGSYIDDRRGRTDLYIY